jgi:two-component sensor histidine kinase/integral membrane sensor domain MASE1
LNKIQACFSNYRWSDVPGMLTVVLSCALLTEMALHFFTDENIITILWPTAGLAVAALLIGGLKYWPAILAGSLIVVFWDGFTWSYLGISLGNTLQAVIIAWFLSNRTDFHSTLIEPHDYLWLTLSAVTFNFPGAANAIALLHFSGLLESQNITLDILHWWQGNILGILLVTPLILIWRQTPHFWFKGVLAVETIACFGLAFLCGQIIFLGWFHEFLGTIARAHMMYAFVVWGAVRFGRHGTMLIIAMIAVQALLGAVWKVGYFATDIATSGLANYWVYMIIMTMLGIVLALSIVRRDQVEGQLRTALIEKDALFFEIHHRVKNNLQVIYSLLSLQAHSETDDHVLAALQESRRRVLVMARIHENLHQSGNTSLINGKDYFMTLVEDTRSSFGTSVSHVLFNLDIEEITLEMERAISYGQIISELLSNCLKHAFPSDRPGRVDIALRRITPTKTELSIADNGKGLPEKFDLDTIKSLGMRMVKSLTHQLNGILTIKNLNGTQIQIIFPEGKT